MFFFLRGLSISILRISEWESLAYQIHVVSPQITHPLKLSPPPLLMLLRSHWLPVECVQRKEHDEWISKVPISCDSDQQWFACYPLHTSAIFALQSSFEAVASGAVTLIVEIQALSQAGRIYDSWEYRYSHVATARQLKHSKVTGTHANVSNLLVALLVAGGPHLQFFFKSCKNDTPG